MNTVDDITLIAYIDGELDTDSCAEFEALLAEDASLRNRVRQLRESTALVRSAFNQALYGVRTDAALSRLATKPVANQTRFSRRWGLPLAASLAALLIGGLGGRYLSDTPSAPADQTVRERAFLRSMDKELSGTPVVWNNPDSGNHGLVTPVRTFQTQSGQYCREFEETLNRADEIRQEGGIACRREDGVWKVRVRFYPE